MEKRLIWEGEGHVGQENLSIKQEKNRIVATSRVNGSDTELHTSWDATYTLVCDDNWQTSSFIVDEHHTNRHLELYNKGNGQWEDGNKNELKDVAGCVDIDFRATPFSNTLPIRRLNLSVGESATINVAYINAPDLAISREQQIYTRLSGDTWKFEQPGANFQATITVDDEGFVIHYPGLFYRIQ